MPVVVTVPDDIAYHAGPVLVGIVLNWWLYGVLCVQYYLYLSKMTSIEPKVLKAIVHSIFLLDTFSTFFMMEDAFYWFVYNFGNSAKLDEFHYSAINMALMDAIIAFVVQLVYCWRINKLSGWRVIPGFISLIALLGFGSGIFIAAMDLKYPSDVAFNPSYYVGVATWMFPSAGADVLIAASTCYLLLKMHKESASSPSLVKKIMRILTLTLETNTITAAVAIEIVIIYYVKSVAPPATKIYLTGGFVLGKLYSNSFMILLNQRHHYHNESSIVEVYASSTHANNTGSGGNIRFGVMSTDDVSTMTFAPHNAEGSTDKKKQGLHSYEHDVQEPLSRV